MTRLLVSVRSLVEAKSAVAVGAHVIDVKEPNRGSLGQADDSVISAIVDFVAGHVPVSVAFGELVDWRAGASVSTRHSIAWAKIGLRDAAPNWPTKWSAWRKHLPPACGAVLVAYADTGPPIVDLVAIADRLRPDAFLIDTSLKDGRNLLDHCDWHFLGEAISDIHRLGVPIALAGSLTPPEIEKLLPYAPDFIAVRGAACEGGRGGVLDANRLRDLARLVGSADSR